MAQGLRARPLNARNARRLAAIAAIAWLAPLPACGGPEAGGDDERGGRAPRAVDVATIAPAELVDAVLDECHRPLRGRMQRVAATVTLPDGARVRLFAELPDRARVQSSEHRLLLRDGDVHRLDATPPTSDEAAFARRLVRLVDAAAFGPLHRATGCEPAADGGYDVATDGEGPPWRLELRPGTLLPRSLARGGDAVRFDDYLRTSTTWVVRRATLAGLGTCELQFDDGGVAWREDFFDPPARSDAGSRDGTRTRMPLPGAVVESRSPTPIVVDARPSRWVLLDDPGTWPERVAAYLAVHEELVRQDQFLAGFPYYWREDDRRRFAAAFRRRPDGPEFEAPADWQVRDVPGGRWLVVYPRDGDLAQRTRNGERMLREELERRGLAARGPITAQPFVHLQDGAPPAAALADAVVRVGVPIE